VAKGIELILPGDGERFFDHLGGGAARYECV
jgi:hypothetical protein